MNLIAAVDKNWGIGRNGALLCRIPRDMERFRALTINKTVVMGRKTLESLPGGMPLGERRNIVLTRDSGFERPGVTVCGGIDALLEQLRGCRSEEIFVIGGGQIYNLLLPYCKTAYITKLNAILCADTYMPDLDKDPSWKIDSRSEEYSYKDMTYRFLVYKKAAD